MWFGLWAKFNHFFHLFKKQQIKKIITNIIALTFLLFTLVLQILEFSRAVTDLHNLSEKGSDCVSRCSPATELGNCLKFLWQQGKNCSAYCLGIFTLCIRGSIMSETGRNRIFNTQSIKFHLWSSQLFRNIILALVNDFSHGLTRCLFIFCKEWLN